MTSEATSGANTNYWASVVALRLESEKTKVEVGVESQRGFRCSKSKTLGVLAEPQATGGVLPDHARTLEVEAVFRAVLAFLETRACSRWSSVSMDMHIKCVSSLDVSSLDKPTKIPTLWICGKTPPPAIVA